jgi:predicted 3-demethylubiquinone-9 3-methyltransferase (glyoxalase superfamily)
MSRTQKITPMLWFDDNAEDAVNHYISIFKNSRILKMAHYGEAGPRPKGSVLTIGFELEGQAFTALNGGPLFKNFRKHFRWLSTAKLRKKWTNSGTSFPRVVKKANALG